jgi:hypothetical protein
MSDAVASFTTACRQRSLLATATLVLLLGVSIPSGVAAQLEAWRAQHDSEGSDPMTFFDFLGFVTTPSQPTAIAPDGSHLSVVGVYDGLWRTLVVEHESSSGAVGWQRSMEGGGIDSGVAVDELGNVYVTADEETGGTVVRKFDADGHVLWTSRLADPAGGAVSLPYVRPAPGGAVYVAGVVDAAGTPIVARFDATGVHEWSFIRELAPDSRGFIGDLAVDAAGSAIAVGSFWNPGTDYLMLKIDPAGDLVWERTFDNGSLDLATSIAIGPQDRVTVTGSSYGENGVDYYTIQYDADGNEIWHDRVERLMSFGGFTWTPLPAVAPDSTGNIYLTGSVGTDQAPELLLAKYAANGAQLADVHAPASSGGRRIVVVEADDRVYAAGWEAVADTTSAVLHAFDLDGTPLWRKTASSPLVTSPAGLSARSGLVVVAASVTEQDGELRDTYWMALNADGDLLWENGEPVSGQSDVFCGPSYPDARYLNRSGSCLAPGDGGATFVSGSEPIAPSYSGGHGHRTLKLTSGGSIVWTRSFVEMHENSSSTGATASAAGSAGDVHVGGQGLSVVTYDALGDQSGLAEAPPVYTVRSVAIDSTGDRYVLADDYSSDVLLMKFLAAGDGVWTRPFDGAGGVDKGFAMQATPADHIVYVGQASTAAGLDALARAYDTDGLLLFSRTLGSAGAEAWLQALALDGTDIVSAGRAKSATDFDALVVRLDSAGDVVWRRDLDGSSGTEPGDDEATAVTVDPAGNVYAAGRTWNGDDFDVFVVKLDPAGNEVWRRAIDFGHGDDEAWSAAFDAAGAGGAAGSLWIAGRASNGNDTDALTMRFDVNGNELFRAVVAGTEQRDDEHYDLVIGPVGHATVAGVSAEIDKSYNMQAIRYVVTPLDADYDGEASALGDGILITRWLFGFRGSVMTADAIDTALCERCPAETIDVHLSAIVKQLDVDGNGAAEPLTDGTLIFRWLFGFRGDTLTTGAVDLAHCTRCDAPAIEAYLEGLAD